MLEATTCRIEDFILCVAEKTSMAVRVVKINSCRIQKRICKNKENYMYLETDNFFLRSKAVKIML